MCEICSNFMAYQIQNEARKKITPWVLFSKRHSGDNYPSDCFFSLFSHLKEK